VEVVDFLGMGYPLILGIHILKPQPYHLQMGVQGGRMPALTLEVMVDLVVVLLLVMGEVRVEEDTPEEEGSQVLAVA
jgi:uncharacterized membrane protein